MDVIFIIAGSVVLFVLGAIVGNNNKVTVDKAIAALKTAEANAKATLDKIVAHKAA